MSNDGLLASVATGLREAQEIKKAKEIYSLTHKLAVNWLRLSVFTEDFLDTRLAILSNAILSFEPSSLEWCRIMRNASNQALGTPMPLSTLQAELRQYAIQYYNPTPLKLNVEPMGLPDEDGEIIKTLVPGGLILIPHSYTQGGRRSVVNSCCPQLLPIPPVQGKDSLLDTSPQSYIEWITYFSYRFSVCCRSLILWSDRHQYVLCLKCKGEVTL